MRYEGIKSDEPEDSLEYALGTKKAGTVKTSDLARLRPHAILNSVETVKAVDAQRLILTCRRRSLSGGILIETDYCQFTPHMSPYICLPRVSEGQRSTIKVPARYTIINSLSILHYRHDPC